MPHRRPPTSRVADRQRSRSNARSSQQPGARDQLLAKLPISLRCGVVGNEFWAAAMALLVETDCVVYRWLAHPTLAETWRDRRVMGLAAVTAEERAIFVPEPLDAWSFGVLAHEVGHQVLHRDRLRKAVWQREVEANEYALRRFDELGLPGSDEFRWRAVAHLEECFERALDRGASLATILDRAEGWITQRLYARYWQRAAGNQLRMGIALLGLLMVPSDPPPGADMAALLRPFARPGPFVTESVALQAQAYAREYGLDLDANPTGDDERLP